MNVVAVVLAVIFVAALTLVFSGWMLMLAAGVVSIAFGLGGTLAFGESVFLAFVIMLLFKANPTIKTS